MGTNAEISCVAVRVSYDASRGWLPPVEPRELLVTGVGNEAFAAALDRVFGARPIDGPDERSRPHYNLVLPVQGKRSAKWLGMIDEHVNLGGAASVAGGRILHVDIAGRGGGLIPMMWDIVSAGLTIHALVDGGTRVHRAIEAARHRNARTAAREWVDMGTDSAPSMVLMQAVYARAEWERNAFDRALALDREPGSKLLHRLGYEQVRARPEVWREKLGH